MLVDVVDHVLIGGTVAAEDQAENRIERHVGNLGAGRVQQGLADEAKDGPGYACEDSAAVAVVIDADPTEKMVIADNAPARILVLMVVFFMMITPCGLVGCCCFCCCDCIITGQQGQNRDKKREVEKFLRIFLRGR